MTKWLIRVMALFCASMASAQSAQPILQPYQHFVDGSGSPCAGCSLYSYQAGTTTPLATYTDASGTSQNTNPIILDTSGAASIWVGTNSYKFALLDTLGTTLWTADQVIAPLPGTDSFLPLTGGTLTGSLTAPYYQFTSAANACSAGQYISGWNASGWICSVPPAASTAGGDLSGTYPNPTVAKVNGGAIPVSATVAGTNASGQIIAQTGTISNATSGNAATATALAAVPAQCTGGQFATGITAVGAANCATVAGASSIATPGYTTLPNGIIIEWGNTGTIADGGSGTAFSFPLAFPHAVFTVTASADFASGGSRIVSVRVISTSSFTLQSDGSGEGARWIAVGW